MTEFENKMIDMLTMAVDEISNIRSALESISDTLVDIHEEQCVSETERHNRERRRRIREAQASGNNEPLPF